MYFLKLTWWYIPLNLVIHCDSDSFVKLYLFNSGTHERGLVIRRWNAERRKHEVHQQSKLREYLRGSETDDDWQDGLHLQRGQGHTLWRKSPHPITCSHLPSIPAIHHLSLSIVLENSFSLAQLALTKPSKLTSYQHVTPTYQLLHTAVFSYLLFLSYFYL